MIDPPDVRIPYTPEGKARWEETPHLTTERITGRTLRADTWEDRALQERCITSDTAFYPNGFYNNYMQIVQAPDAIVIRLESMHDSAYRPCRRAWSRSSCAGTSWRLSPSGGGRPDRPTRDDDRNVESASGAAC